LENTVNIQQTNGRSVTEALPGLLIRRNRVGAESQEGRLLSTLIQQVRNYAQETDPVARANLERFMGWTMNAIQRTA
jgi:hypothetical protein